MWTPSSRRRALLLRLRKRPSVATKPRSVESVAKAAVASVPQRLVRCLEWIAALPMPVRPFSSRQRGGASIGLADKALQGSISWKKCEESLDAAVAWYDPEAVTLVFPRNLTAPQRDKFEQRLVARHPEVKGRPRGPSPHPGVARAPS
jgi:hypothetical protein